MPPNLPIIERITAEIAATLDSVVAGDDYNFAMNVVRPKRVMRASESWNDLDVLVVQSNENGREKSSGSSGIVSPKQQYNIYGVTDQSDEAETAIDTRSNLLGSDIVTALRKDPRRNDLAEETDILSVDTFMFSPEFSGILVRVEVRFNIKEDDPTVKS